MPTMRDHHPAGKHTNGKQDQILLAQQAKLAPWPTPSATDHKGGYGGGADEERETLNGSPGCCGAANYWSDSIVIECRDNKARRISPEPSFFPLANGIPGRVAMLKGFGNAIVPPLAAEFIKAFVEIENENGQSVT
jgi:hypothetical protein